MNDHARHELVGDLQEDGGLSERANADKNHGTKEARTRDRALSNLVCVNHD